MRGKNKQYRVFIDPNAPIDGKPVKMGYKGKESAFSVTGWTDMEFPDGTKVERRMFWVWEYNNYWIPYRGSLAKSIVIHCLYKLLTLGWRG